MQKEIPAKQLVAQEAWSKFNTLSSVQLLSLPFMFDFIAEGCGYVVNAVGTG